ncbi:hypothetical protein TNCV_2836701 [Trichonephila clavipes]|nr:hypothetical protein TNCV_2836701 [Trichonephila clavipes]
MDDNATCHRTLAVQDCLDSEGIQRLVWPAFSRSKTPLKMWDGCFVEASCWSKLSSAKQEHPSSVHSQRNGIIASTAAG